MATYVPVLPSPSTHPVSLNRNVTLLLVDDDPTLLRLLANVLALAGYSVVTAADGRSALEAAAITRFDMLVTDFQMPNIDGCTLAGALTRTRPGLPVLIVSGSSADYLPMEEIARRDWNYLPKPIDTGLMLRIIEWECAGRKVKSSTLRR